MDISEQKLSVFLGLLLATLVYFNTGIHDYFAEMGTWGEALGVGLFVGGAGYAAGFIGHEAYRRLTGKKEDE